MNLQLGAHPDICVESMQIPGDGQAASAIPKKEFDAKVSQPTLLAQLFGETLDLRSEHLAARLREDVGEVAHDDEGNKPTPPMARQP